MILRPVTPVSPIGPPMTNRPVGLMKTLVFRSTSFFGRAFAMTSSRMAAWSLRFETLSECWVETTTVSMRADLAAAVLDGHLALAVRAEEVEPAAARLRELARDRVGVLDRRRHELRSSRRRRSRTSCPGRPRRPCRTPCADVRSTAGPTATSTAQVLPSKPISPRVYPMRFTTSRASLG